MRKQIVFIILILSCCGALLFPETLEEILAKNYQTRGGLEKLKAIKTMEVEGKMVMAMQNMEMPITMWIKKPDKLRMEATIMEKKSWLPSMAKKPG
jgi:outer membrane lipoprotein-sorting protein